MTKKRCIAVLSATALLFLIFTFLDLAFSRAVISPETGFARWVALTGDAPLYLLLDAAGVLLLLDGHIGKFRFLGILSLCLGLFFGANRFMGYAKEIDFAHGWIGFLLTAVYAASVFLPLFFVRKRMAERTWTVVAAALAAVALSLIVTNLLKMAAGRVRFEAMMGLNEYAGSALGEDAYTPWYVFHFRVLGDAMKSFPSGHTGSGAYCFALWYLPVLFPALPKWAKRVLLPLPILITFVIALARVMMGAHFATDTLMAVILSLGAFLLAEEVRLALLRRYDRKRGMLS